MSFLLSLTPQIVLTTSSRYNHDILVVREWGGMKLLVNGSRQSGSYIRMLWNRALRRFGIDALQNIKNILVLGVGGGTVIELLVKRYPQADITAVDVDQTIIDIAKRYFQLDGIPRLRIIRHDAHAFTTANSKRKKLYDLVIVDLFIGPEIPRFVSSEAFLGNLYRMVEPHGHVLINFLRELTYQEKSDVLLTRLNKIFPAVRDMALYKNRFFFTDTRFADAPARRA